MERSGSDVPQGDSPGDVLRDKSIKWDGTRGIRNIDPYWDWAGDEIWCDVCGRIFQSTRDLVSHRRSHFVESHLSPRSQWDYGQNNLRDGIDMLWDELMKEHDLPRMMFLYGDDFRINKRTKLIPMRASWMPAYRARKVRDDVTGVIHDAIVCNSLWMRLDPEAKCASIAHVAAHIENLRHGIYDITFNRRHRHTRDYRDTARTYDLHVENVPELGFAMTHINDTFRAKHRGSMRLIETHHPITILQGAENHISCTLSRQNIADWSEDQLRNFEQGIVRDYARRTQDPPICSD